VTFELRHGSADPSLMSLAQVDLSSLSGDESREAYMRARSAAETGSAFAMCLCARWPDTHGRGKPTDNERYTWAERAAATKYPPGLFELGLCFEKGIGVPRDLAKARELYEESSTGGFGLASHRLGTAYVDGQFGEMDARKAVDFMKLAVEQGEPLAALQLGRWFESEGNVSRDLPASVRWYELASEMGDFFATQRLQLAYTLGELGLPRDGSMAKRYEARLFEQTKMGTRGDSSPS
jgi:TPR repeat protein